MIINTEYDFYIDSFGGSLVPEAYWNRAAIKAEQRLISFTFDRMPELWNGQPWINKAKCAVCEMVEYLYKEEKRDGKISESTDGYSVSYKQIQKSSDDTLYKIATVYLGNTGLMDLAVDYDYEF